MGSEEQDMRAEPRIVKTLSTKSSIRRLSQASQDGSTVRINRNVRIYNRKDIRDIISDVSNNFCKSQNNMIANG